MILELLTRINDTKEGKRWKDREDPYGGGNPLSSKPLASWQRKDMTIDALASILHRPHRGKSYHLWTSSFILFFSVQLTWSSRAQVFVGPSQVARSRDPER